MLRLHQSVESKNWTGVRNGAAKWAGPGDLGPHDDSNLVGFSPLDLPGAQVRDKSEAGDTSQHGKHAIWGWELLLSQNVD